MDIRVEGISKEFGSTPALHGIDLDIQSSELVALLGPSGSGKTTLLRVIAGLEQPTSGTVFFGSVDASQLNVGQRNAGFVFQNYALFRHMNVFDNVAFGLHVRRKNRPSRTDIKTRVMDLLELVQLQGLEKRFAHQLSGGQRQRVALARALAIEPRVLLLDEPFGALDTKVRKELRAWMRSLQARTGYTTLFVTHDQEEALELADRVVVLNKGFIEQQGTPDDIYDQPSSSFVHSFIGEANDIPVQIRDGRVFYKNQMLINAQMKNEKARLFVRPQHIVVSQEDEGLCAAKIQHIQRHGPIRRAVMSLDHETTLEADIPQDMQLAKGQMVGIQFKTCRLYTATGALIAGCGS